MQTTNKTGTCKRLLALALCLCMIFSMFPAVVHAEEAVAEPVNLLAGSDFEHGVAEWTRGTVMDDPDGSANKVLSDNWMISKNLYLNDGNYYQLTFKYKANAEKARQANVRVVDYNANGDVLGVPYSLNDRLYTITNSDGWYDYSKSPTSWEDRDFYFKANVSGDSSYAYSVLEIRGRNTGHYLDDVVLYDCGALAGSDLATNGTFENVEARDVALEGTVAPTRREILEPAGITTWDRLTGWNFYGASEVETGYVGNSVKYQAPVKMQSKSYNYGHPFNKIRVEAGKTYVISFWLNSETQAASRVHFRADSYSGETKVASNAIEANNLHAGNPTVKDWLGAKTSWQRYQVEYEVPENVDSLDYKIWVAYREKDSTTGMGYPLWIDQLSIVEKQAPHIHSHSSVVTDPTCTEDGYTTYTCSCGDSYTTNEVAATGHTPGTAVKENVVAATCTVDGSYDEVIYCTVETCKAKISSTSKTITAPGHTNGTPVKEKVTPGNCTTPESYDEVVYCTVETCKAEVSRNSKTGTAPGHTPGTAVKENVVVGNCTTPESYDSVVYCTVDTCKAEISRTPFTGTTPGHTPGTPVKENEVPATCTVDGSYDEVVYCTVETCKAEVSRTSKPNTAPGHTPGTAVKENVVVGNCTTPESYDSVIYCTVDTCKAEISRTPFIGTTPGHTPGTPVKEKEVPATCTVDGSYDEVVYCTVETCKAEVSRTSKPITAPGHTPGTAVKENVVVGNCTTPESYDSVVYCTVDTCKAEISRTPFTGTTPGHTPGTPVKENVVEATCTADGSYNEVIYCTVETCKAKISSTPKTITSSGHDYTHSIVVTDPTLFKEGYTTYTCHCGAYYTSDYTEPGLGYEIGSTGSFLPGLIIAGAGAEKEMSYGGLVLDTEEPFVLYGYGNGETGENDLITRAQMATLLYRSLSTDNDYIYNPMYFNDVPAGAWYETPVDILSSAGVMVGYNGYFNPNDNLTWAQIITIMARFVDYEPADMPWGYAYSNHWANKAIETAYALGWIEDPLTLKPDQAVTRGEVVEFVNHVFDVFNGY